MVGGPGGSGKTRLVHDAVDMATIDGLDVASASCDSHQPGEALHAIRNCLGLATAPQPAVLDAHLSVVDDGCTVIEKRARTPRWSCSWTICNRPIPPACSCSGGWSAGCRRRAYFERALAVYGDAGADRDTARVRPGCAASGFGAATGPTPNGPSRGGGV